MQRVLDRIAVGASLVCAIHCAVLPILTGIIPALFAGASDDSSFHLLMALFVLPTSVAALLMGCLKHRKVYIALTMGAGITLIGIAAFAGHDLLGHDAERVVTLCGGVVLAIGHVMNYRLCGHSRRCNH